MAREDILQGERDSARVAHRTVVVFRLLVFNSDGAGHRDMMKITVAWQRFALQGRTDLLLSIGISISSVPHCASLPLHPSLPRFVHILSAWLNNCGGKAILCTPILAPCSYACSASRLPRGSFRSACFHVFHRLNFLPVPRLHGA